MLHWYGDRGDRRRKGIEYREDLPDAVVRKVFATTASCGKTAKKHQ
jgi:hypothetical protein